VGESRSALEEKGVLGYIFGYTTTSWPFSEGPAGTIRQFYKDATTYYHYYIPKTLHYVIMTDGDTKENAFIYCDFITRVELPSTVTLSQPFVFFGCGDNVSALRVDYAGTVEMFDKIFPNLGFYIFPSEHPTIVHCLGSGVKEKITYENTPDSENIIDIAEAYAEFILEEDGSTTYRGELTGDEFQLLVKEGMTWEEYINSDYNKKPAFFETDYANAIYPLNTPEGNYVCAHES
jgi:hypothetical protein